MAQKLEEEQLEYLPLILWFMYQTGMPLTSDNRPGQSSGPDYGVWIYPDAGEIIAQSPFVDAEHHENGYIEYRLNAAGKILAQKLFARIEDEKPKE